MTKHEHYQQKCIGELKGEITIPSDKHLVEIIPLVVEALVARGQCLKATQLLFGVNTSKKFDELDHQGARLFGKLASGLNLQLLKKIAGTHSWVDNKNQLGGWPIHIYPGEYLLLKDPLHTEAFQMLL